MTRAGTGSTLSAIGIARSTNVLTPSVIVMNPRVIEMTRFEKESAFLSLRCGEERFPKVLRSFNRDE